jgi:integrase
MLPDETAASSAAFLHQAGDFFARLGIPLRRVLTDNGPCFYAHRFAQACRALAITHKRTRIYTPRTNGKAERFIQTALREWAYARRYETSAQRLQHLQPWTHQYNWHRPHPSLDQKPPISRSGLDVNNLLRHHMGKAKKWKVLREWMSFTIPEVPGRDVLIDDVAETAIERELNSSKTGQSRVRHQAWLETMIMQDTGMRPSEVFAIRLEDIHWAKRRIWIPTGKTKRARRFVGISERMHLGMATWCRGDAGPAGSSLPAARPVIFCPSRAASKPRAIARSSIPGSSHTVPAIPTVRT